MSNADTHTLADTQIPEGLTAHGMRRAGEGDAAASDSAFSPAWPSVHHNLSFETYLRSGEVSKSSLWTAISRSPAHARVEKEESNAMKMGSAVHCAVLEPDCFEERFHRGPDDRRGNRWKEAVEEYGAGCLTSGDYDGALKIRDALQQDFLIRKLTTSAAVTEMSGFFIDAASGLKCRFRPDAYHPGRGLMADIKMTTDARPDVWRNRVRDFGYHAQEAIYTDGSKACGLDLEAFVFIVVEDKAPFAHAIYELEPAAVAEGREAMRKALDLWADCKAKGVWPAYPKGVQPLDLPKWGYRHTDPATAA